jgi:hypothetical protein
MRDELAWDRVVLPLRALLDAAGPAAPRPRFDARWRRYAAARAGNALTQHGAAGSARRLVRRIPWVR